MIIDINQKSEIVEFSYTFARKPRGFLLLAGSNGTGKTHCALEIYHGFSPYKLPAYDHDIAIFVTQADLNIWWTKELREGDSLHLLEKIRKTKLLVIDDLGTRTPSEPFMDFLYAISDYRYTHREKKGTIITTNLTVQNMRDKFSDAFVSRVASGTCFRLEGPDRRFNTPKTAQDSIGCEISAQSSNNMENNQNAMEAFW